MDYALSLPDMEMRKDVTVPNYCLVTFGFWCIEKVIVQPAHPTTDHQEQTDDDITHAYRPVHYDRRGHA